MITILNFEVPLAFAAITKSFSFIFNTWLRNILANGAHHKATKTIITFCRPAPKTLTTAKANKLEGNVDTISANLIIKLSIQPPQNPEMSPRGIPISNIPAKTTKEFNKVVCAPYSKRDKIHRPR